MEYGCRVEAQNRFKQEAPPHASLMQPRLRSEALKKEIGKISARFRSQIGKMEPQIENGLNLRRSNKS